MTDGFTQDETKYFQHLYASKRRLKRRVIRRERCLAESLSGFLTEDRKTDMSNLESNLEWLLTWKLKTGCCPEIMWCDGVKLDKLVIESKRIVFLQGQAWIGPEEHDELDNVPFKSTIELRPNMKNLKAYQFEINFKGLKIDARRT